MIRHLYPFILFSLLSISLSAQDEPKKFRITGNLGISTEFYDFSSNDSTLLPRRPDFNYRMFFNPTFHFGKNFSLPLNFLATKQFNRAYLPLPDYSNPLRSLTNPNNAIGLSPTFGWATFHMGSHTTNFSELSTGNTPIFGAGIDLKPGLWRIAYSYGVANWALQPDTRLNLQGAYRRRFQALKLGWGEEENYLYLNTTKVSDDESSVEGLGRNPEEGALFTLELGLEFTDHITGEVEIGASAFTKDTEATGIEDDRLEFLSDNLFTANETTRLDYANIYALSVDYPTWGLTLKRKKLGAGYEPLGWGFVETDVLDYTVSPRLQLFKNKFILNATGGLREDNLSNTKIATTERLIISGNVLAMFTPSFSVSGSYTNYGSRNNVDNDTLRLEFVSKNLTLTPTYRIQSGSISHTISATFAQSDFDDKNLFSGELASNQTTTFSGSYMLMWDKFSFMTSGTYMDNSRSTGDLSITTVTVQPGYSFLKRKMNLSVGLVYAIIGYEEFTDSKRFIVRPKLRWRLTPKLTFSASGSLHTYRYGTVRNNAMYDESYLQTGLTQRF